MRDVTDDYLEKRLIEWGEWFIRNDSNGLGSPQSTLGRLIVDGGILTHAFGPKIPPENPSAQEIEDIVSSLVVFNKGQYSKCMKALKLKYTLPSYIKMDKLARKAGISSRTFRERILTARICVKMRLS